MADTRVGEVCDSIQKTDSSNSQRFMHDDRSPPCLLKMSSQSLSMPVEIAHVPVVETEYLLDYQEELIGTPLKVQFDSSVIFTEECLLSLSLFV